MCFNERGIIFWQVSVAGRVFAWYIQTVIYIELALLFYKLKSSKKRAIKGITKGKLESLLEMITAIFGVISYIILGKTGLWEFYNHSWRWKQFTSKTGFSRSTRANTVYRRTLRTEMSQRKHISGRGNLFFFDKPTISQKIFEAKSSFHVK